METITVAPIKALIVSEGMLFDTGHADGLAAVLAVPEVAVPDGARAG